MPDLWELWNGLDVFTPDGAEDSDGDGLSNYAEWLAGTDPHDAESYLRLKAAMSVGSVVLNFPAMAGRSYTLLSAPAAGAEFWFPVTNITAAITSRNVAISQPADGVNFYRVVTPAAQ